MKRRPLRFTMAWVLAALFAWLLAVAPAPASARTGRNVTSPVTASHTGFDAFGKRYGTAYTDPFGYQAQWGAYTDRSSGSDSGLVLMGYRYYDPTTGRFLTRDPVGYAGGINLYAYCRNNPVNLADPLGLCPSGETGNDNLADEMAMDLIAENELRTGLVLRLGPPLVGLAAPLCPGSGIATGLAPPDSIRFIQDSVRPTFRDGRSLYDLVEGLRDGTVSPSDVEPIRVFEKDGAVYTLEAISKMRATTRWPMYLRASRAPKICGQGSSGKPATVFEITSRPSTARRVPDGGEGNTDRVG